LKFYQFIISFLKSKGIYVFTSIVLTKLISFSISYIAIRQILKDTFGEITYANSIISFVVPFMGMGAYQGLIRFGARFKNEQQKFILFNYAVKRGLILSLLISGILFLIIPFLTRNLPGSSLYFKIIVFQIVGLTFFEFIKSYFRLIHKNHLYAIWDIIYYTSLLSITLIAIHYLGAIGYVLAIVLTPFIISLIIIVKYKLISFRKTPLDASINFGTFWKYGLIVSVGAVSSQFLYGIDIVMVGNIIKDSGEVAAYKASGLIPFSLRFVPGIFITTDYIKFAENEKNRVFLSQYFLNYLKIFLPLSIIMIFFFYLTGNFWGMFFGSGYEVVSDLIWIFSISIAAGFILRIPLGNLLTATDWAQFNAYVSIGSLILNVVLNYLFIFKYGIVGAAWATSISMWISGIITLFIYLLYLKKKTYV
jgi:O-antigen/teichoic acid export membrane protein